MRLFFWLFSLALLALGSVFALANKAPVPLSFWPFDAQIDVPLALLLLLSLFLGFLLGALAFGPRLWLTRRAARRLEGEKKDLKGKLDKALAAQVEIPCSGPTILSHGRYQPVPPPPPAKAKRGFFASLFKGKPK